MARRDLLQSLQSGKTPQTVRMAIAQGLAPLPPDEMLELLVCLLADGDSEISSQAGKTLAAWDEEEVLSQLQLPDCSPSVLEYFSAALKSDRMMQAIISNPSSSGKIIASLALTAPAQLLEGMLDNRTRIIDSPIILENIRRNPSTTPEIQRLVSEIEIEFLGGKRKEYNVGELMENAAVEAPAVDLESEIPPEDLSLEGLPQEGEDRQAVITNRLGALSVREKIRYALFGNREIRAVLVRDTNKEVARNVLHSPKLTESEVEGIAAMRSVSEDILREIGSSREWTRSYAIVHNLVKNPKTPPAISQRLMIRLRSPDLTLLTRDRSISDAVRHNAVRVIKQRTLARPGQ
jgi:hypothetical protein